MKIKLALILALQLIVFPTFAADQLPPPATINVQTTQPVIVVSPGDDATKSQGVQIDLPKMPEEKKNPHANDPIRTWSGDVPVKGVIYILIASMPVLASLYFAYQLFLFIQARRRRLSIRHQREN
ncbi:hypothetical protein ACO0KY_16340 [Undibacterium sp. Dicai25W]|uniref:hypothetical protein n=1 Tax=Undibacterium sp. Dicai25W TaxID=3413034 RepID=UPI003BF089AF